MFGLKILNHFRPQNVFGAGVRHQKVFGAGFRPQNVFEAGLRDQVWIETLKCV